jgi:adenosylcobyric acid synthase
MAQAIMVLGTASHVGKSLITTGLCRIFAQKGYRVAPFKAQNMSLNSAVTPDGLEIGRSTALQAEAAGIEATVDMNPVLIKPQSGGAQLIVRGRIHSNVTRESYNPDQIVELFPLVVESYIKLANSFDIIVLEGAGSPVEINLKSRDIVNMRMAKAAAADCLLVADIDRGGVFASILGTYELLESEERELIKGFVINKFRGETSDLLPGVRWLEKRLKVECRGIVPFLPHLGLDEEDSVSLEKRLTKSWNASSDANRELRVAVISVPHISNFTDFDSLASEPSVSLSFIKSPSEAEYADLIILPGSKQTINDLLWLHQSGFTEILRDCKEKVVVGICGGMQMLGEEVADPHSVEGGGKATGIGLLAIRTILDKTKTTVRARGQLITPRLFGFEVKNPKATGYEIHGS